MGTTTVVHLHAVAGLPNDLSGYLRMYVTSRWSFGFWAGSIILLNWGYSMVLFPYFHSVLPFIPALRCTSALGIIYLTG